jgi:hypothetical protein
LPNSRPHLAFVTRGNYSPVPKNCPRRFSDAVGLYWGPDGLTRQTRSAEVIQRRNRPSDVEAIRGASPSGAVDTRLGTCLARVSTIRRPDGRGQACTEGVCLPLRHAPGSGHGTTHGTYDATTGIRPLRRQSICQSGRPSPSGGDRPPDHRARQATHPPRIAQPHRSLLTPADHRCRPGAGASRSIAPSSRGTWAYRAASAPGDGVIPCPAYPFPAACRTWRTGTRHPCQPTGAPRPTEDPIHAGKPSRLLTAQHALDGAKGATTHATNSRRRGHC